MSTPFTFFFEILLGRAGLGLNALPPGTEMPKLQKGSTTAVQAIPAFKIIHWAVSIGISRARRRFAVST
jgi:hypothetical protein